MTQSSEMGILPIVNFSYAMANPTVAAACGTQSASYANETNLNNTVTKSSLFQNGAHNLSKLALIFKSQHREWLKWGSFL